MIKKNSLIAYSGAACTFILFANSIDAQVIYTDIDPDKIVMNDDEFSMDLNGDLSTDIIFKGDQFLSFTSGEVFSTQLFYINNYISLIFLDSFIPRPEILHFGDVVGSSDDFTDANMLNIFGGIGHFDYFDSDIDYLSGTSWVGEESIIGFRMYIGAEAHYGWIRLRLDHPGGPGMPYLIIQDYAFNETPDEPMEVITFSADFATDLALSDIGESNTAVDLQLYFNKAEDESTLSSYRVILFTGDTPSLESAITLDPERFTEVIPTGDNITISFNASTLDVDGLPLAPDINYKAIVLSVADSVTVMVNALSTVSNTQKFELKETSPVFYLTMVDILNDESISDFKITFNHEIAEYGIAEYRVIISESDTMNLEQLLTFGSEYYQSVTPAGSYLYEIFMDASKKIYTDDDPVFFKRYYVYVIAMPDMVQTSIASLNAEEDGCVYLLPSFLGIPLIYNSALTATIEDINVQFEQFYSESYLELYRIVVVKETDYPFFDNTDALFLPANSYLDILPTGSDININFPVYFRDINGVPVAPGQPYRVFVLLKSEQIVDYYSLSDVSEPFILSESVGISDDRNAMEIFSVNNFLHIQSDNIQNKQLTITNNVGAIIFTSQFETKTVEIDLNFLSAGIYFAVLEEGETRQQCKIVISH